MRKIIKSPIRKRVIIDTDIMNLEMEMVAYGHSVLNFIEVQTEDVNKMIDNNDSFFLYIGRITCQWCRRMVPVLNKIAENEHIEIYYLDSEETESNSLLSEFREKYEIETVPAILSFDEYGDYYMFPVDFTEESIEYLEQQMSDEFEKIIISSQKE